jgi:PAS domain S-box-containing protein
VAEFDASHASLASDDSEFLLALVDYELRMMILNKTWQRVLGFPRDLLVGKPIMRLMDKDEIVLAMRLVKKRTEGVSDRPVEFSLHCQDGSYRCFAWMSTPSPAEQGMFISGRDITERKKMETTDNLQRYMQAKKTGAA